MDAGNERTGSRPIKRRAACDECRTKKLKCTGEQPSCSRCVREDITCVYSAQKQMGRPKKRQRIEDEEDVAQSNPSRGRKDKAHSTTQSAATDDLAMMTPGGSLQPWLLDFDNISNSYSADSQPPGLTPDNSSSNSPPLLNLPPELMNTTPSHNYLDPSTRLLLEPSLASPDPNDTSILGLPPTILPSCACLSTMYLTLSTLSTLDPLTTPFPFALHPLRNAMQTAADVLACEECPRRFISAIQNTQIIGTLLMSIAERFGKVLDAISAEAERADQAGERKTFRLADLNTSTSHLHTGGIGCAAAFSIDLSPAEWRALVKKVVRAEVQGAGAGNNCCVCFETVVAKMENRQELWHDKPIPLDFPKDCRTGLPMGGDCMPKEDHLCLKFVKYARRLVEGFDWN